MSCFTLNVGDKYMSTVKTSTIKEIDWEAMTLADGYLFAEVMKNEELCRGVIGRLLRIKDISNLGYIVTEQTIKPGYLSKGVRLDVYVQDEGQAFYNLEMQAQNTKELHKRSRYYSSTMDVAHLKAGKDYLNIQNNHVIFICQEDIFDLGLWRYSFENMCTEVAGLKLEDGACKVFFNAKGYHGEINPEAKGILDLTRGIISEDPFIQKLAAEVERIKNNEQWRMEYMDIDWVREKMDRDDARREGRAEGKLEGKVEGRAEVAEHVKLALGKGQDLAEVTAQITGLSVEKVNELTA